MSFLRSSLLFRPLSNFTKNLLSAPSSRRPGFPAFTLYITVKDGNAAIDYYQKAFDAKLKYKLTMGGNGVAHAELNIFDTVLMLADEQRGNKSPLTLGGTSSAFCIYVDDCDAAIKKAVEAGGKLERAAANQFYGDRQGAVIDPFGHKWMIATFNEEVSPEEMQKKMDEIKKMDEMMKGTAQE